MGLRILRGAFSVNNKSQLEFQRSTIKEEFLDDIKAKADEVLLNLKKRGRKEIVKFARANKKPK